MAYHGARRWFGEKGRIANFLGNRGFIRLTSSESSLQTALLASNDGNSADQQIYGDIQDNLRINNKLQRRVDELGRALDELRRTTDQLKEVVLDNDKNERHGKTEIKNVETTLLKKIKNVETTIATLNAEIRKMTDRIANLEGKFVNKNKNPEKIAEIEIRNAALEEEMTKLKKRLIYLEINSIQNTVVEYTPSAAPYSLDQIEEERPSYYDEIMACIIILVFFVGFLIGMRI